MVDVDNLDAEVGNSLENRINPKAIIGEIIRVYHISTICF
jgi:hypothetical protein